VLATFIVLQLTGNSVNSMVLGGLALALSRLIDNSVVVLENIFRHIELGEPLPAAAETGGREVALPVLAATLTTVVVFFPVTMLYGVSKFLFTALAFAVVVSLFASYFVALTVVPLFCSMFIKAHGSSREGSLGLPQRQSVGQRFNGWFSRQFERLLAAYDHLVLRSLQWPRLTLAIFSAAFLLSLLLFPLVGRSFFPQTDAGQFLISFKAPSGTKLNATEQETIKIEQLLHHTVAPGDLGILVSNIGVNPGFSALFSPNSAMHTGVVQVSLNEGHRISSFAYIEQVKRRIAEEMPELSTFFSSGSLIDGVLNMGTPAPFDIQVAAGDLKTAYDTALNLAAQFRRVPQVADVYIPQDLDYPSIRLNIDRIRASELGLTEKEVVSNVITALTSNVMIAPSIWIDPRSGNNYFLSVQYKENQVHDIADLRAIPLHGSDVTKPTRLDMVASVTRFNAPTEVDHYQIRRKIDIYIRPAGEDLGRISASVDRIIAKTPAPHGVETTVRGSVEAMNASFHSFAIGLALSVLLLYLILVAQFRSFLDPGIILLALPPGIIGVMLTLSLTDTTLNIMSLMGIVMLAGIAMSNSILIVEFAHHLLEEGLDAGTAVATACKVRLRPILMTSLATLIGLLPMALKLGEGSEAYAPLARVLIGGLAFSVLFTVFIVPAGFYLAYRNRRTDPAAA